MPSSASQRGLIGNRIPSLDPKTAGMVGSSQGQRKVSDNKGLFGNRIPPSSSSPGLVPAPSPASAAPTGGSVRSNSPGSVDSSYKPGSSNSPHTSRSSSPATSLGVGIPPSLVEHSLPERGGSGTATPSSTRADIGEETHELSPPTTPIAAPEMPQDDNLIRSDLTPHNLPANAVAANPMLRTLSIGPTPSLTSSMASQYDSKGGSEDQTQMMHDVSGISTPMGTPRAAARDLEGSLGGSVKGGSVSDIDDLGTRLEGLDTDDKRQGGSDAGGSVAADAGGDKAEADKEEMLESEPAKEEDVKMDDTAAKTEDEPTASTNAEEVISKDIAKENTIHEPVAGEAPTDDPQGILQDPEATVASTTHENKDDKPNESSDRDPNLDKDLDDLKEGKLEHDRSTDMPTDQTLADDLAGGMMAQNIIEPHMSKDEMKHQGGVAGQRMEDVENQDEVIQPDDVSTQDDGGPEIRDVTSNVDSEEKGVAIEDGKDLGPRGTLDGPQRFSVEFLEKGRGTEKAAQLDQSEYHMAEKAEGEVEAAGDKEVSAGDNKMESNEESKPTGVQADQNKEVTSNSEAGDADANANADANNNTKPMQVQIEPAPIAQPATETEPEFEATESAIPDTSDEPTPSVEIDAPSFPAPPSEDPDVVDPISSANSDTGASTPLDPSITKAFPDVPDEEKPRVEVHVSSPLSTPSKEKTMNNFTPLADIPGKSKSLQSLAAESEPSASEDDLEGSTDTPEARAKHMRRLSARKSPKSPLLDDEDPGDFEPGEGWAVVTK
jgi:hypothetical protein